MLKCIISVDPGLSGAVAVFSETGDFERVVDLPVSRDGKLSWIDGGSLQSTLIDMQAGRETAAIIERVHSMNTWAKGACFNFGAGYGAVLSILQARRCAINFVQPATWKKALGLVRDKEAALNKARLLYPGAELHLKKHDGRAEAILVGHYWVNRKITVAQ